MTTLLLKSTRCILRPRRRTTGLILAALAFYGVVTVWPSTFSAWAANLERPEGRVILKISGRIAMKNSTDSAEFDRKMLEALPAETIETDTPWTDGIIRFEGPSMREILKLVGAQGTRIVVTAINDYSVDIPIKDFDSYNVVLAMTMNGEPLRTRTKGPLWIIYPWRDQPKLRTEIFYGRAVWQTKELTITD